MFLVLSLVFSYGVKIQFSKNTLIHIYSPIGRDVTQVLQKINNQLSESLEMAKNVLSGLSRDQMKIALEVWLKCNVSRAGVLTLWI